MSEKISELPDVGTLDGSEQVPLVQAGVTSKVTVNDLLPVQLQASKTIDLNFNDLSIVGGQLKVQNPLILGSELVEGVLKMYSANGTLWDITISDAGSFVISPD